MTTRNSYEGDVMPYKYIYGCIPCVDSRGIVRVTAGQVRDDTNSFNMTLSSTHILAPKTIGVSGFPSGNIVVPLSSALDKGTYTLNTVYTVFVVGDSTKANQPRILLSLSQTEPVMPIVNGITYSIKRLLGYLATSLDMLGEEARFSSCEVSGKGAFRKLLYYPSDSANLVFDNYIVENTDTMIPLKTRVPNIIPEDNFYPFVDIFFRFSGMQGSSLGINNINPVMGSDIVIYSQADGSFNTGGPFSLISTTVGDSLDPVSWIYSTGDPSASAMANVLGFSYGV